MISLPKKVYLRAIKKHWKISYVESPGKLIIIEHPHRHLVLYGTNYTKRKALVLLNRWVRLQAHTHLTALLKQLNRRVKAKYKKLIIRAHEAQWGACSARKTISLNSRLIFLPPPLVKHVILHELCHTHYLTHAQIFWDDLERYDKHWKRHRAALDDAYDYVPEWIMI